MVLFKKYRIFLSDRLIQINLLLSLILVVASFVLIFLKIKPTNTTIPLHYNIYFGIDYMDVWYKAYGLPVFGALIYIINSVLALMVYREKLLSYFFVFGNTFAEIIVIVATIFVVLLNI